MDRKPDRFPIPNNNELIGNAYSGESLLLLPMIFQASIVFGARRRATSAWLAEETHLLKITPPVIVLKAIFLIQIPKRIENICLLWTTK